jgi:hypothetical protein
MGAVCSTLGKLFMGRVHVLCLACGSEKNRLPTDGACGAFMPVLNAPPVLEPVSFPQEKATQKNHAEIEAICGNELIGAPPFSPEKKIAGFVDKILRTHGWSG